MVKQLNTRYISVKDFHLPLNGTPEEIARGRKEFDDAGLIVLSGGVISFPKDDDADIRHKFEYAKLAGFPMITAMPTAKTLPKVEKMVKEYDIRMALHNHGKSDKNFPTPQDALRAVEGMDPRCGLCIDVGHTAEAGADVVESIHMAGSRLLDVHIKDESDLSSEASQVPVGEDAYPSDFPGVEEVELYRRRDVGIRSRRKQSHAGNGQELRVHARGAGGHAGVKGDLCNADTSYLGPPRPLWPADGEGQSQRYGSRGVRRCAVAGPGAHRPLRQDGQR